MIENLWLKCFCSFNLCSFIFFFNFMLSIYVLSIYALSIYVLSIYMYVLSFFRSEGRCFAKSLVQFAIQYIHQSLITVSKCSSVTAILNCDSMVVGLGGRSIGKGLSRSKPSLKTRGCVLMSQQRYLSCEQQMSMT